jgi:hypothetical protein
MHPGQFVAMSQRSGDHDCCSDRRLLPHRRDTRQVRREEHRCRDEEIHGMANAAHVSVRMANDHEVRRSVPDSDPRPLKNIPLSS